MNSNALAFVWATSAGLLLLPRRWAALPLMVGVCYMTLGQGIDLGPFSFTVWRILVAIGGLRVILRNERWSGRMNGLDWLMVLWAALECVTSVFHSDPSGMLIERLGKAYDALGAYFLIRIFCRSVDELVPVLRVTAILLLPLGIEMLGERLGGPNYFKTLVGLPDIPDLREGKIRAAGPFSHSILAGTVGGISLPFMIALWRQQHRVAACLGMLGCVLMIFSSRSSGPIMTAVAGIGALYMFPFRDRMRSFRWFAVVFYVLLDIVMQAPAYYLMARIDLVGGSGGWHRARLIETTIEHLNEWWLGGTDFTRHWMPTGVSWSPNHTDITNHYIHMGVEGGLPLMLVFIWLLVKGFSFVGQSLKAEAGGSDDRRLLVWVLGSTLFAHAATFLSVSYFDQSVFFFYLPLAAISSVYAESLARSTASVPAPEVATSAAAKAGWRPRPVRSPGWRPVPASSGPTARSPRSWGSVHPTIHTRTRT